MGINAAYFSVFMDVLGIIASRGLNQRITTACLSYPDVMVSHEALSRRLSPEALASLPRRPDSHIIRAVHNYPDSFGDVVETSGLFQHLGLDPVYFDIAKHRGSEVIIDLNEELPESLHATFDLVLDTGTLEHCFNIGTAFKSMCSMVKRGGYIMTSGPLSMTNHGFWNFSPAAYHDFFTQNGFIIKAMAGLGGPTQEDMFPVDGVSRFKVPSEAGVLCVAKRIEMLPLRWPIQSKYKTAT